MRGCPGGSYWCAPRLGLVRRPCWPIGPGVAAGRWPGCRSMLVTMTRRGFGGTRSRRWIGERRESGERRGPLLGAAAPLSWGGLVKFLINNRPARRGKNRLLLVLANSPLIDPQRVKVSLVFLLEHLPWSIHLVRATRAAPPL